VQRLRRGARSRSELVSEQAPELVVNGESVGGVPSRVERSHQEPVAALAVRLERDERAPAAFGGGDLGAPEPESRLADALERARLQRAE
jgi:hypothetical protein